MRSNIEKNSIQFDYFSSNYEKFEEDFYKFSNINIPLTFLTDDILKSMIATGDNYFVLNSLNASDHKDHYFIFKKYSTKENKKIVHFEYLKHKFCLTD